MNDDKNPPEEMDANISPEERSLLDDSIENAITQDNTNLKRSTLDNTDEDGEPLNEIQTPFDVSGDELDVPGSEADDDNEALGQGDEENNYYSLPDQDQDQ